MKFRKKPVEEEPTEQLGDFASIVARRVGDDVRACRRPTVLVLATDDHVAHIRAHMAYIESHQEALARAQSGLVAPRRAPEPVTVESIVSAKKEITSGYALQALMDEEGRVARIRLRKNRVRDLAKYYEEEMQDEFLRILIGERLIKATWDPNTGEHGEIKIQPVGNPDLFPAAFGFDPGARDRLGFQPWGESPSVQLIGRQCPGHERVDTGMRKSWCKHCNANMVMDQDGWKVVP